MSAHANIHIQTPGQLQSICNFFSAIEAQPTPLNMEIEFDINSVDKIPDRKYECKYYEKCAKAAVHT